MGFDIDDLSVLSAPGIGFQGIGLQSALRHLLARPLFRSRSEG